MTDEWTVAEHVSRYLDRADEFPHRAEGERVLFEQLPLGARRVLDLGTGDGRLLAALLSPRPEMQGVGVDLATACWASLALIARHCSSSSQNAERVVVEMIEPLRAC